MDENHVVRQAELVEGEELASRASRGAAMDVEGHDPLILHMPDRRRWARIAFGPGMKRFREVVRQDREPTLFCQVEPQRIDDELGGGWRDPESSAASAFHAPDQIADVILAEHREGS